MQPRDFFLFAARLVDRVERVARVPMRTFNCTRECVLDDKWEFQPERKVILFRFYFLINLCIAGRDARNKEHDSRRQVSYRVGYVCAAFSSIRVPYTFIYRRILIYQRITEQSTVKRFDSLCQRCIDQVRIRATGF